MSHTHRRPSLLTFTALIPLLAAACAEPDVAPQILDQDEQDASAPTELVDGDALVASADPTLPIELQRAGVAAFEAQPEHVDPAPPAFTPAPPPPRPEGDYVLVQGFTGPTWVPFRRDGDALMIGDDIYLGPASMLDPIESAGEQQTRALGLVDLGKRWPDGVVYYDYNIEFGIPNAIVLFDALARIEGATPLRFVLDTEAANRIHFINWDEDYGASALGMVGGVQEIKLPQSVNVRTVVHEVLHALGRWHEQQRPDRDNHVDYHPECVRIDGEVNFTKFPNELVLGPYDLASILHYRGTSQCAKDEDDDCICAPLTYSGTDDPVVSPTSGCDQRADPLCMLSDLDIGATWTMYGDFHDDHVAASDYFGWATVAGDFDGDGLDDVASSAVLAEGWRGKVMTLKGSYGVQNGKWEAIDPGVVPWRPLRRPSPAVNDLFGISLVAADFDDDGFDDLAVGASGVHGHGAVYLFRGARAGLRFDRELLPTTDGGNLPFANARYGAALAAADINNDGVPELLVGAPGDRPGAGLAACGGVYAYALDGASDLRARWSPTGASCVAGVEAGAALAGATRSAGAGRQIIVGAPGAEDQRGRAWVLNYGDGGAFSVAANLTQGSPEACGVGGVGTNPREPGDRFGAAIAAGLRHQGVHIIAIGSPGEDDDAGQVDVFRYSASCWAREQRITQSQFAAHEAGDLFGAALAIGDLTGDGVGDLIVGAPGEAVGAVTAGWIYSLKGVANSFTAHQGFGQSSGGWTNGNGERFGQSFALAEVDGNDIDLIVGAPGNHVSAANYAGSLFLWQGRGDAKPAAWRAYSVDSKSPYAP